MAYVVKNKKLKVFYVAETRRKPTIYMIKHYIHSKESEGFWAHIRDVSNKEKLEFESVRHENAVVILMGYNPAIINNWDKLILETHDGKTFKINGKPDEYAYDRGDMKITATAFIDNNEYTGELYGFSI